MNWLPLPLCRIGQLSRATARDVATVASRLVHLSEAELLEQAAELRWRARCGSVAGDLVTDAFAAASEACRRAYGYSPVPEQIIAAASMLRGGIIEMQTGEGKTLVAVLAATVRALAGRGCHVVTTNDYLAGRDAVIARPVVSQLGLTVAALKHGLPAADRRRAYANDITYGTEKEFGFDFLRDRVSQFEHRQKSASRDRSEGDRDAAEQTPVQRELHCALVDEADSILIDQARTPLIISSLRPYSSATETLIRWSHRLASQLAPESDFHYLTQQRSARLTEHGCQRVQLGSRPAVLSEFPMDQLYRQVEFSLAARLGYGPDREFVVINGEVQIVDESTGRVLDGRKWRDGLQQAIEAQAGVSLSDPTASAARVTLQSYFRRYEHLSGMTGTADSARPEFRAVYGLRVTSIPTHRPCRRVELPPRVFATRPAKLTAIVAAIEETIAAGRAVLVGTSTVEASEELAAALRVRGVDCQLLHAREHEREAEIIGQAGSAAVVTIATNLAGRGTDIRLSAAVRAAGGLHVIATEMQSSSRIDRQLIGRAARQGDPGSFQFFVSLDDTLLEALAPARRRRLIRNCRPDPHGELHASWIAPFYAAQQSLERRHFLERRRQLRRERSTFRMQQRLGLDPVTESLDSASAEE